MDEHAKNNQSNRDRHSLRARDANQERELANQAEWRFREVVQSYSTHIASPVYLTEVVDKARSAAQYRRDSEGLKDSSHLPSFTQAEPNTHVGVP
jgi:HSP90 family molecular chaperone